ncbi:hypothetical protein JB92DRAFT_2859755 [Gautieria morchelliformis]|nr:hypothetical protein JB92DRAFT_2859755 [Gautieria morchelliformis]
MHPLLPAPTKTFHILLSYPLSVRNLITFFHGATYQTALHGLVQNPRSIILVVYADRDQFTSLQSYEPWVLHLKTEAKGQLATVLINGGDHFWGQRAGEEMCTTVGRWLDER